jgi:competence protein ComEA
MQGTRSVQKTSIQKIVTSVIASGVLMFSASAFSAQAKTKAQNTSETQKPAQVQTAEVASVINLNKADVQTLAQLNGVGEKKAQAIIAYRESKGGFKSVDELLNVKGIGEKFLEKNRSFLSVN